MDRIEVKSPAQGRCGGSNQSLVREKAWRDWLVCCRIAWRRRRVRL